MWPMYVDYSDEECRRALRGMELEAYAIIVNVFRAHGPLTKERKKMLFELSTILSIPMERHRAEIRRAVNDEHLNTIAERLYGPNTSTEWAIEGRRAVPLMPRQAPQTVFTAVADSFASSQAAKNAALPLPGKTGVREVNGVETMTGRRRKEPVADSSAPPNKIIAMDTEYLNSLFEGSNYGEPESSPSPSANAERFSPPDSTSQVSSSLSESAPVKTITASVLTSSASTSSPIKLIPKQIMLKSSSTITTFSSSDQLSSNILASKSAAQSSLLVSNEEQVSSVPEVSKVFSEPKSIQRTPISSLKSTTILPVPSSSSTSSSSDRLSMSSSSSMGNKFLTQVRCKSTTHSRQSLPSSLGFKLNPQSQIGQKGMTSKPSPSLKVKTESASNFFTKKITQTVFSTASDTTSQFSLTNTSESSISKSPISISKSTVKADSCVVSSSQGGSKLTTVTKGYPKTSTPSSQYMARSLFSTTTKAGAKSLPPVIFNVSSSSVTPIQSSTKTTVSTQNEGSKTSPQLLPKSQSVGLSPNQLKIKSPSSIQYRNEGGVVRSARIVNISQPVGNRLPCAITPSAISALGLSPNMASTALRVTLPAGTLNTSAGMRVTGAAKPNVIVVHKAQMWPRTQQGAAVIMSSAASLPKISDVTVTESTSQKQEKVKVTGSKLAPRPIAPAPTSGVSTAPATIKLPDTSILFTPPSNKSSTDTENAKQILNAADIICKKNLLADVIEESGILESASEKAAATASIKSKEPKEQVKVQSVFLDSEIKTIKKIPPASSFIESTSIEVKEVKTKEANNTKQELLKPSESESSQKSSSENGRTSEINEQPSEQKEGPESQLSSYLFSESTPSTGLSSSIVQKILPKEKNL